LACEQEKQERGAAYLLGVLKRDHKDIAEDYRAG
jgi:hypothetical protein